jgi:hypothetical protein
VFWGGCVVFWCSFWVGFWLSESLRGVFTPARNGRLQTPLPQRGRGVGVRAKSGHPLPTANPSDVPLSAPALPVNGEGVALTLLSLNTGNRDMESGSGASAYASASQSVYGVRKLRFRPTLKRQLQHSKQVSELLPSPTAWGEGLGVREDYRLRRRSPTSPASPAPNANRLAGSGTTNCKRTSSINGPYALLPKVRLVKLRV